MMDAATLSLVCLTFLIAGSVKGVIGMGLPTVSLSLLTATLGLHPAMALLLVPTFVTNIWQGLSGGHLRDVLKSTWFFLVIAVISVWPGVLVLSWVNVEWLSALLGALIILYALLNLKHVRLDAMVRNRKWAGPVAGACSGLLTGMTGSSVFPGVAYLQTMGLPRDVLIQAMGVLFCLLTLALGLAMGSQALLSNELLGLSAIAVLPAMLGMVLGQLFRRCLSEKAFREVFLSGLLIMGVYILFKAFP